MSSFFPNQPDRGISSRPFPRCRMRLLFSSIHSYLDPSSGAALATREMLELLAGRGMDCRVLSAGVLDYERETALDEVLATLELPARRFQAELARGRSAEVIDLSVNGVRVTLMPTASSRAERAPDPREAVIFLELAEQVFDRLKPDVLLTYGGHPASIELMRRARRRGIAVVFHLHNFGYNCSARVSRPRRPGDRRSQGRAGARSGDLSVDNAAGSGDPRRTSWGESGASKTEFINPQPSKGMTVFARIAVVLNEANTPDPRDFYRSAGRCWCRRSGASPWAGLPSRRWRMASQCWPATEGHCPRRWATRVLCSRFRCDAGRTRWKSQPRAKWPRGWPCWRSSGTTRRSKPGTGNSPGPRRGGGCRAPSPGGSKIFFGPSSPDRRTLELDKHKRVRLTHSLPLVQTFFMKKIFTQNCA
jgi:hypothetical protein